MTVQEKMKEYREKHGYSIDRMSLKSGASTTLLRMLERGNVTHPNIARRIGKAYGLSEEDIYELMPKNHRPGADYNPDKYVEPIPDSRHAVVGRTSQDDLEYYSYLADAGRLIRKPGRRFKIR